MEEISITLGRFEHPSLEFKRDASDRGKICKAICALANDLAGRGGGDLLIGVDDTGAAYQVDISDEALLKITDIRDGGQILERPTMTVDRALWDGHEIIRVHVTGAVTPPIRFNGVVWVRPGPTTRSASANDEQVLAERRLQTVPFDSREVAGTSISDLDVELARSTYVTAAVDPDVIEENDRPIPQQLRSLKLLGPNSGATATGLLVCGFDPTAAIPGAYIQFVRYAGDDQTAPIRDEEELRGNIIATVQTLEALLAGYVETRIESDGILRDRAVPSYPTVALREAIMNAIAHRTYEGTHAPVRISWFDDMIEISNPGGAFGVVDETNYVSMNDYRNPSLAAAMKTLGYVNRFGRGISRIQGELQRNGNPPAEFQVDNRSWLVTMRRAP